MADALDVIGDRWALLILRDVFLGHRRFEQFRKNTGASRATLTRRLELLVNNDILYKRVYSVTGTRFEYKLTEKGLGLFAASLLIWQWEYAWAEHAENSLPQHLFHSSCGNELSPVAVCKYCNQPLKIDDVEWPDLSKKLDNQFSEIKAKNKQRRVRSSGRRGEEDLSLKHVSSLIGDRWSLLIIIAAFLGESRYDRFQKQLHIATNILTLRLNLLVDATVLMRVNYQENPPRSEYRLTEKGKSLYSVIMAMRQWAVEWAEEGTAAEGPVAAGTTRAEVLIHKSCNKPLVLEVHCSSCSQKPWPNDVQFS